MTLSFSQPRNLSFIEIEVLCDKSEGNEEVLHQFISRLLHCLNTINFADELDVKSTGSQQLGDKKKEKFAISS
jgi:hypothetical protein